MERTTSEKREAPSAEAAFIRGQFRAYYSQPANCQRIRIPVIDSREFGAGFEKKIDFRHKSFPTLADFHSFLVREAPFYVSSSTAHYRFPSAQPMQKKIFLGADLVFDLDRTYETEPHPGNAHSPIACEYCLARACEDGARFLEEFLCGDFGFKRDEVATNFSGSKGFHFHLRSQEVQQLSADARRQLCEYAAAYEVDAHKILREGTVPGKRSILLHGPSQESGGWQKKVLERVVKIVRTADEPMLSALGLRGKKQALLLLQREEIAQKLLAGNWGVSEGFEEFWRPCVAQAISSLRVETDAPVSFDLSRLIRVPNTLHGDTGLVAIAVDRLETFRPLEHAVAFPAGSTSIIPSVSGAFVLGGRSHELTDGVKAELPLAAALLVLCRKKGTLALTSG